MDGDMSATQPANTPAPRDSPPDEPAVVAAPRAPRGDRYRAVFVTSPAGMVVCDRDGTVVETNPALRSLLGYTDSSDAQPGSAELNSSKPDSSEPSPLQAATVADLFPPEEAEELLHLFDILAQHENGRYLREQRQLRTRDGDLAWAFLAVSPLGTPGGITQYLITVEESSELHLLQDRLHHQSLYDALTGLPNRQYFSTHLQWTLANAEPGTGLTLYYLGLEALELINNGLGSEIGDSIIKTAGRKLAGLVEEQDGFLARLGGTEFAILVRETESTPGISVVASLINEELAEPVYVDGHGIATSASIGVNRAIVGDDTTADATIWGAEVALRRAEAAGRRQWVMFDPDRAPEERIDAKLAAVIPGALELGDFQITYRPVLSMSGRRLAVLWAQLNWCSQERGWLNHAQCLDLAERSGVTLSLRDWMLRAAWEQTRMWHTAGYQARLLVDLSGNQTHDPDLMAAVRAVLRDTSLHPQWLWLSVPMDALLHDEEARENLTLLAELGISMVVHGFRGTAPELRHLRELPINVVRLDSELVDLVHADPDGAAPEVQAIARVIPLVNACGPRVGVHGVHVEDQAERWRGMGSSFGAGDLYGEAILAENVTAFLHGVELSD